MTTPNTSLIYTTNNNGTSLATIDPATNTLTDLGTFYDENILSTPLNGVYGLAYGISGDLYVTQQLAGANGTTQIWKVNLPRSATKLRSPRLARAQAF